LQSSTRSIKDYLFIALKGLCMGAADVVPGVSGGTIAFITGIYDEWLDSLKRCTPAVLLRIKREGIVKTWQYINGNFLVAVFGGILISLKTFAALITLAMASFPILVWAFFFGLIIASIYLLGKQQKEWRFAHWFALLLGAMIVLGVSLSAPAQLPGYWWVLFLGGFIAICAMILPGISGSFILLLVGLYPVFLNAINTLDVVALASFGAGCICGLVVFSRFLSWLLTQYHSITLATLIGFLVGSLYVTWPWKEILQTTLDRHGKEIVLQQRSVMPDVYTQLSGNDALLGGAILCAFAGIFLVVGVEFIAAYLARRKS
jgi:putative membrane protein